MEYVAVVVIVVVAALVLLRRALRSGKRGFPTKPGDPCAGGCEHCPVYDVTGEKPCGSSDTSDTSDTSETHEE